MARLLIIIKKVVRAGLFEWTLGFRSRPPHNALTLQLNTIERHGELISRYAHRYFREVCETLTSASVSREQVVLKLRFAGGMAT